MLIGNFQIKLNFSLHMSFLAFSHLVTTFIFSSMLEMISHVLGEKLSKFDTEGDHKPSIENVLPFYLANQ